MTGIDVVKAWADGTCANAGNLRTDGETLWLHCTPIAVKTSYNDVKFEQPVTVTCGGWATNMTSRWIKAALRIIESRRQLQGSACTNSTYPTSCGATSRHEEIMNCSNNEIVV